MVARECTLTSRPQRVRSPPASRPQYFRSPPAAGLQYSCGVFFRDQAQVMGHNTNRPTEDLSWDIIYVMFTQFQYSPPSYFPM